MMEAPVLVVVRVDDQKKARSVYRRLRRQSGRPAAGEGVPACVHFMSIVLLPRHGEGDDEEPALLLIEVWADGPDEEVIPAIANSLLDTLWDLLQLAGYPAPTNAARPVSVFRLASVLSRHRIRASTKLFRPPGLTHIGSPGMTVDRIGREQDLAARLRAMLNRNPPGAAGALAALRVCRAEVFRQPDFKWAFDLEPAPLLQSVPRRDDHAMSVVKAAARDFLPAPALVVALLVLLQLLNARGQQAWYPLDLVGWLLSATVVVLASIGAAAVLGYRALRRQEDSDTPIDQEPDPRKLEQVLEQEDRPRRLQNHLAAVSIVKRGWFRLDTLRFALWTIAETKRALSPPGHLGDIGSIHFAHWALWRSGKPLSLWPWRRRGAHRLIFVSNYDGSWQSYLEEFIARQRAGMTSIWSNTENFPKTSNLVAGGVEDGERFKRWARRQQVPSLFWHCAYPELTAKDIRTHVAMRHGLVTASTEAEAVAWLSLFGFAGIGEVAKAQVSALAFGGLAMLPHGHCLLLNFGVSGPNTQANAKEWLRRVAPSIAYGEHGALSGRSLVVGFTATGLKKLGLDDDALATFPVPFQTGMHSRFKTLGDDPTAWGWGGKGSDVDAVLVICATQWRLDSTLFVQRLHLRNCFGVGLGVQEVPLKTLPARQRGAPVVVHEPFGFRDGLSQPRMRGTRHWARPEYANHVVEPGELVLGYPDNLGYVSPVPKRKGVDIGSNGTFLVIRQLEQNKTAFDGFVSAKAKEIAGRPQAPGFRGADLEHWVAAKMMGRWRDGSSLIRHLHPPDPAHPNEPDNDFLLGKEDPDGTRCPFGAHVRRANPRDSFDPGSQAQVSLTNRHRVLRVGREYEPGPGQEPGILFMCINASIERQFELLQQTWLLGPSFMGLRNEVDPVVGHGGQFTIPTQAGPIECTGLAPFVKVLGGAYFFLPSRRAVEELLR